MAAAKSCRGCSWPDLPSELLGLVLLRLPSHADRVRLRAVCHSWRCNARLQEPLPPPLPWIALPDGDFLSLPDGDFLSLPDGVVHRLPVPDDDDVSQRVSAGSVLFLVRRDDTCCLMNPWSSTASAMTPLPELAFCFPIKKPRFVKVVASDHLVAALTKYGHVAVSTRRPPQGPASSCSSAAAKWAPPRGSVAIDIALFKGKLYVLTTDEQDQEELHVLEDLGNNEGSIIDDEQTIMPAGVKSVQCIRSTPRIAVDHDYRHIIEWHNPYSTEYYTHKLYLVPSGDRLLLVKRMINKPPMLPIEEHKIHRTRSFEVFEAAGLSGGGHGRWSKVDTLMGHALFVSNGCCKSLVAGQCGGALVGAREDSIYYINEETARIGVFRKTTTYQDPILDSGGVYNMRDRTLMPLPLEATVAPPAREGPWRPTWLFPAES